MALGSTEFGDRCSSLVDVVVDNRHGELSWGDTRWTVKCAGTRLFVECARLKRRRSICLKLYTNSTNLVFDDSGMTMTMEQIVTQLQQEVSRWDLKLLINLDFRRWVVQRES